MKLTVEDLKEHDACKDGLKWFKYNFGEKSDGLAVLKKLEDENKNDWYIFLLSRIFIEGANLETQDEDGNTALRRASCYGYTKIVKLLIEHGADVEKQNNYGTTALMCASSCGHTEIVKMLEEAKEKTNGINS